MSDSAVEATQHVVPLLDRVMSTRAFAPQNKAVIGLILLRFHRLGAALPVKIADEEFRTVMHAPSIGDALISRRWFEATGMIERFEDHSGDNYYVPKFYGIQSYIKSQEAGINGSSV